MRLLRTLGVVVGMVVATVAGLAGSAGAAPTAPYDAFTINGTWSASLTPANARILFNMRGPESFTFFAEGSDGNWFDAIVSAPTGQFLAVGTFATTKMGDATHYGLSISGNGSGCNTTTGSVTIHVMTRDASTGEITSLAASYRQQDCLESSGELRWKSTRGYVETVQDPTYAGFTTIPVGQTSPPKAIKFTSTGTNPITLKAAALGGRDPGTFKVTANTCTNVTLNNGQSCTVMLTAYPTSAGDHYATLSIADDSTFGSRTVPLGITGQNMATGQLFPVRPFRMLDTRSGNGAPARPLGPGGTLDLQLTGRNPIPDRGVAAVVLNVTVTQPTAGGFLSVYPTGTPRPTASSINFPAGWTGANSVTVPVSADGKVTVFNLAGNTHVIVDISGWYASDKVEFSYNSGLYHPHNPTRVLDTRDPAGPGGLNPDWAVTIPIDYGVNVNPHVRAFALNITATAPQTSGLLIAWNGLGFPPDASVVNFTKNATVPNFAIVPTALCSAVILGCPDLPSVTIVNVAGGAVHVVVDVVGFYDDDQLTGGLQFTPISPTRITDTREGLGAPHRLTGNSSTTITAPNSVAGPDTVALSMTVTGVNPDGYTFLSLWPAGAQKPTASTLNLTPHEVRANAAAIGLNATHQFSIYNQSQTVDLVIDVGGRFDAAPSPAGALSASSAGPVLQLPPPRAITPYRHAI